MFGLALGSGAPCEATAALRGPVGCVEVTHKQHTLSMNAGFRNCTMKVVTCSKMQTVILMQAAVCSRRTMADASPLTRLTNLQRLHVWLGASSELPPCSNKPLRGFMAAVGQLTQLTDLQLLKGLYLSWELRKIVHLDGLTSLQVMLVT